MATQQTLLEKPTKSLSKTVWLILSVAAILTSSAFIASYLIKPTSLFNFKHSSPHHVCHYALDTASCLLHVSEVGQGPTMTTTKDHKFDLLNSFLMKSTSHIQRAMDEAKAVKLRINSPREEAALRNCVELMDLSMDRVWDSMVALTKGTTDSVHDAHTWLSTVLTNHDTCLDGLEGTARALMEAEVEDLMSRARTSLAMLVAVMPPNPNTQQLIDDPLNGEFPSWVTSKDRKLLESEVGDVNADVVVAKDKSGNFKTVAEAVASAPDNCDKRYVIYVKKGTYKENVEIGKKKKNVMLVGDGKDATIITGSLNYVDGVKTINTATVAAIGSDFIAQDIGFQNTAGPYKDQAVALRVAGDKSVINRCSIDAYQDSLYTHTNRQFFRDSYVTGTVDFIFGNAAVVFQNCKVEPRKPRSKQKNTITAQSRTDPNQNTGISIQQCSITASADLEPLIGSIQSFLGRPWKDYARTVVMQSYMDKVIDPAGWLEWQGHPERSETLYYGEYMNYGPGAGTAHRVNWTGYHVITTTAEASQFTVKELIQGNVWLPQTGVNFIEGLG